MRKIDTLRAAILDALPELNRDPDRLRMWIEKGSGQATSTQSQGLAFAFQLNVLVVELASDIAVLGLAVVRWMRVNQPDLLVPGATGFDFDADILDNGTADVHLQLQLDQAVSATPLAGGKFKLEYRGEPDPLFAGDLGVITEQQAPRLAGYTVEEDLPPWEV